MTKRQRVHSPSTFYRRSDDDDEHEEHEEHDDAAEEDSDNDSADKAPSAGASEMEQDEDEEQVSVAALHVSPRDSQSQDEASGRGLQLLRDELKKLEAAHETLKQTHTNAVTVRDQALEEVKRLQEMTKDFRMEIARLRDKAGEAPDGTTKLRAHSASSNSPKQGGSTSNGCLAPLPSLTAGSTSSRAFGISLMMPENYTTVTPPHHFKDKHSHFPHRVNLAKDGVRVYIVESRILVQFAVKLLNRFMGDEPCSELQLPTKNPVRFKLEILFVNNNEPVKTSDFRTPPENLLDPPEAQIQEVPMVGGEARWKFHTKFLSRNTKNPTGQAFRFRISCLNPELQRFELDTTSIPFVVVSRDVRSKKASAPPALA